MNFSLDPFNLVSPTQYSTMYLNHFFFEVSLLQLSVLLDSGEKRWVALATQILAMRMSIPQWRRHRLLASLKSFSFSSVGWCFLSEILHLLFFKVLLDRPFWLSFRKDLRTSLWISQWNCQEGRWIRPRILRCHRWQRQRRPSDLSFAS